MQPSLKNLALIVFSIFVIFTLTLLSKSSVNAWWYLDSSGQLQYEQFGSVLGKQGSDDSNDSDDEDNSGSGSSGSGSSDSDSSGSGSSGSDSDEEDESDDNSGSSNDDDEENYEEFKLKIESYSDDGIRTRIRIERKDGRLRIRRSVEFEGEDEGEDEFAEGGIFEIREHNNKTRIRIATGSGNFVYFVRGNTSARTNFPLSINTETNELLVTTPAGIKVVTILPDQAVANMLAQNVLDEINAPRSDELPDEDIGEIEEALELEEEDGTLVYKIRGIKRQRVLGIFDVVIDRTAVVSAETGELISIEQTFFARLLDLISF